MAWSFSNASVSPGSSIDAEGRVQGRMAIVAAHDDDALPHLRERRRRGCAATVDVPSRGSPLVTRIVRGALAAAVPMCPRDVDPPASPNCRAAASRRNAFAAGPRGGGSRSGSSVRRRRPIFGTTASTGNAVRVLRGGLRCECACRTARAAGRAPDPAAGRSPRRSPRRIARDAGASMPASGGHRAPRSPARTISKPARLPPESVDRLVSGCWTIWRCELSASSCAWISVRRVGPAASRSPVRPPVDVPTAAPAGGSSVAQRAIRRSTRSIW